MLKYDSRFTAQVQQWHHDVAPQIPIGDFVTYLEPKLLGLEDEAQFYAPVELSVHVKGAISDAAGAMRLHVPVHANNQWLPTLQERIGALFGADSVELKDVCGRPLSDFSLDELDRVGKLHVFVDGKKARLNSMPEVPLEYSINKLDSIYTWYDTVKADLPKIVAQELIQCESAADLVEAIQQGGRVEQRIASHLLNTTRDVDEFVRVNHMNSPYSIEDGAAVDVFGSIASSLRSTLQEFISASSKPIQNYFSAQEAKKMADRLQSKGQDASAFVPLFSQASSASVNGFELFESLAESMIGLPAVTDDIVNTIYVKPLGPCQRWNDEKAPPGKSGSLNVRPTNQQEFQENESEETDMDASPGEQNGPLKEWPFQAQSHKGWFDWAIGFFSTDNSLKGIEEAKSAEGVAKALNRYHEENAKLLSKEQVIAIMAKLQSFDIYNLEFSIKTIEGLQKTTGVFLEQDNTEENRLQNTIDIRAYVSQMSDPKVDTNVKPNNVRRAFNAIISVFRYAFNLFTTVSIDETLYTEIEQASSPTAIMNVVKRQMEEANENKETYPGELILFAIQRMNTYPLRQISFTVKQWEQVVKSLDASVVKLDGVETFSSIIKKKEQAKKKKLTVKEKMAHLRTYVNFFEPQTLSTTSKSAISAHNPLLAQLHHTIKPINNAFPAYYTERHLTEDMTENAPYSAPIAETYDAYHLYAGMAPFPEPIERKHKGKKWKKGKNHRRRMSHSKSVESQMPRMIPVSSKAPPVRAICSKLSKEEEEQELKKQAEKDKRSAETSLNQNHSEYRSRIGRAPPIRPIESTKKSDSDYFSKSQLLEKQMPTLVHILSKAPPVRPIGCGHSSSKKKPAADSDSEEERDYSAKSQLAPPVRPIEGKHSYKSDSESESEEDYKSSKSSIGRAPPVRPIDAKAEMRSRLAPIKKMPALPTVADLFK